MKRVLIFSFPCVLLAIAVSLIASQTATRTTDTFEISLPKTYYRAIESDPDWLSASAQFHGHLGPALVFGCWAGAVALDAIGARGYFGIVVTATGPFAKPPESCVLDGLQMTTGATLGKRNLNVVISEDEYVIKVENRRTGASVEIRPTQELLDLMAAGEQLMQGEEHDDDHDDDDDIDRAENAARQLLKMDQDRIMTVKVNP
jgi:formylmethanofuran dehydrogenase subunit E